MIAPSKAASEQSQQAVAAAIHANHDRRASCSLCVAEMRADDETARYAHDLAAIGDRRGFEAMARAAKRRVPE